MAVTDGWLCKGLPCPCNNHGTQVGLPMRGVGHVRGICGSCCGAHSASPDGTANADTIRFFDPVLPKSAQQDNLSAKWKCCCMACIETCMKVARPRSLSKFQSTSLTEMPLLIRFATLSWLSPSICIESNWHSRASPRCHTIWMYMGTQNLWHHFKNSMTVTLFMNKPLPA